MLSHCAKHIIESAAIDVSGTLFVAVCATTPVWFPSFFEIASVKALALAQVVGVDPTVLVSGPPAWGMREHVLFCIIVLAYFFVIENAAVLLGGGARKASTITLEIKDQAFAIVNRVISIILARHMLEFAIAGSASPPVGTQDVFQIPAGLMQKLRPPEWNAYTPGNTLGALVACFVVYDLLYYSFQRFIRPHVVGRSKSQVSAITNPLQFLVNSYLHLVAVMLVALNPLGCHPFTVLSFLTVGAILEARNTSGIRPWIPQMFFGPEQMQSAQSNYGKYLTLWDNLCHTRAEQ